MFASIADYDDYPQSWFYVVNHVAGTSYMPMPVKTLSVKQVEAIKAEGRHAVGGAAGLYLLIAGEGRSWILRVKVGNTRTDIGLGSCADVSLGRARERADELRRQYKETGVVVSPRGCYGLTGLKRFNGLDGTSSQALSI